MMFDLFLVAYPWDLPVEDMGAELDQLRGEVGVTGLSLWVGVPATLTLRVVPRSPRVLRTGGGLFFQPMDRHYAQTRCQPIVSSWVTRGSPLGSLSKACVSRDLKLRAIVSASATGRMAERYPECTCRNAFGDESNARLCLANPEVQTYLRGMVADLSSNDGVSAVTVADFEIRWSDVNDLQGRISLGLIERSLLEICFCGSCRRHSEAAGIDVEAARQTVEHALNNAFEHGPTEGVPFEDFLSDHRDLAGHRLRQTQELNSLLRKLKDACHCDLLLEHHADDSQDEAMRMDLSVPSAVVTGVDDRSESPMLPLKGPRRNELRLAATIAAGANASRLVRIVSEAAAAGFAAVEFDHYGILSESALTTLKQGIRFARRGIGGQPT